MPSHCVGIIARWPPRRDVRARPASRRQAASRRARSWPSSRRGSSRLDRDEPPPFSAGDTVNVACEITEGSTKRIQNYAGVVIQRSGAGLTQTFTVRKMSSGIGVERTFPVYAPSVTKIEVLRRGAG